MYIRRVALQPIACFEHCWAGLAFFYEVPPVPVLYKNLEWIPVLEPQVQLVIEKTNQVLVLVLEIRHLISVPPGLETSNSINYQLTHSSRLFSPKFVLQKLSVFFLSFSS
jgi:hypothetical protein